MSTGFILIETYTEVTFVASIYISWILPFCFVMFALYKGQFSSTFLNFDSLFAGIASFLAVFSFFVITSWLIETIAMDPFYRRSARVIYKLVTVALVLYSSYYILKFVYLGLRRRKEV